MNVMTINNPNCMHLSKLFENSNKSSPKKTGETRKLFLKKQIFSILYLEITKP
jgi:hypothetical protein